MRESGHNLVPLWDDLYRQFPLTTLGEYSIFRKISQSGRSWSLIILFKSDGCVKYATEFSRIDCGICFCSLHMKPELNKRSTTIDHTSMLKVPNGQNFVGNFNHLSHRLLGRLYISKVLFYLWPVVPHTKPYCSKLRFMGPIIRVGWPHVLPFSRWLSSVVMLFILWLGQIVAHSCQR